MVKKTSVAMAMAIFGVMSSTAAYAHGDDNPELGKGLKPPPVAILQLDQTRDAAARFLDVDDAVKAGYVDIGLFVPNMGWHYMKESLVDEKFDWTRPELLVYADDPVAANANWWRWNTPCRWRHRRRRRSVSWARLTSGTRTRLFSSGRCTRGSTSSTRTVYSHPSTNAFLKSGTEMGRASEVRPLLQEWGVSHFVRRRRSPRGRCFSQ
jgi:hypothetical protein